MVVHSALHLAKRVKTSDGHKRWMVNVAAVLDQMSTGGGATLLKCAVTPMNVPGMSKRLYTETEQFLSETIRDLTETMTAAG